MNSLPSGKVLAIKFNLPANDCNEPAGWWVAPSTLVTCCKMSHYLLGGILTIMSKVSIRWPKNSITCLANTLLLGDIGTPTCWHVSGMVCMMMSHTCCRMCAVKKSSKYLEIQCFASCWAIHCRRLPTFSNMAHDTEAPKVLPWILPCLGPFYLSGKLFLKPVTTSCTSS